MAVRLEDMLRPGERRLYETPHELQPLCWSIHGPRLLLSCAAALVIALLVFESGLGRIVAAVFILLLLTPAYHRQAGRIVSVVTERRAFMFNTAKGSFEFDPIDLSEVRAVEQFSDAVPVARADGGTVLLKGGSEAPVLAAVLARAAGLTAPPSWRRAERTSKALEWVFLLGLMVMFVARNTLLPAQFPFFEGFPTAVFHSLALVAVMLVWMNAVGMIGLVLLRPFFSREELRQVVLRGWIFLSDPCEPKSPRFLPRLYLRLVDRLYGGPGNGTAAQVENHGG